MGSLDPLWGWGVGGHRVLCGRWGGVPGSSVGGLGSPGPLHLGWGPQVLCTWVRVPRSSVGGVGSLGPLWVGGGHRVFCGRWGGVPGYSVGGVGSLDPL